MNTFLRIVVSLIVGVVAFAVVAVGVTAAFESQIAFSLLVGVPVGISAALTAMFATYVGLSYRDRRAAGTATPSAERLRWAAIATIVDFVVVTALGTALSLFAAPTIGLGLLIVGLPVTLALAAIVGYVVGTTTRDDNGGTRSFPG